MIDKVEYICTPTKVPDTKVWVELRETARGVELWVNGTLAGYLSRTDKHLHLVRCTNLIDAGVVGSPGNLYIHVKWDSEE